MVHVSQCIPVNKYRTAAPHVQLDKEIDVKANF